MTGDYPKEFLTEQEAAEYINMSVKTLRRWRFDRRGPNYAKIAGKSIRYPISDLQEWIKQQIVVHDWWLILKHADFAGSTQGKGIWFQKNYTTGIIMENNQNDAAPESPTKDKGSEMFVTDRDSCDHRRQLLF